MTYVVCLMFSGGCILQFTNNCDVQVHTMASGALPSPPGMKFFFYATEEEDILRNTGGGVFLAQVVIVTSSGDVSMVCKTSSRDAQAATHFVEMIKRGLAEFSPSVN